MSKIDDLESLLPGFQQFLQDLSFVALPSALAEKVKEFQQIISDYLEQHSTAPQEIAPCPPSINTIPVSPINIEEQRQKAWRLSKTTEQQNNYQNTQFEPPGDFYELPMQLEERPALPSMENRPPIKRVIAQDDMSVYENPEDSTTESGRGSMAPGSVSDEGSGGSFIFRQSSESQSFYDNDSDASTDYEDMDDDIAADKTAMEKQKKPKINKVEEFKKIHENDQDYDLIGLLFSYGTMIGTMKAGNFLAKWEKRYCIAKDGQLLLYKSYKEKKPQRMPMMGYEVYFLGQQSNKEHVFRIYHNSMKHPLLFATESRIEADKWVAVLTRYATIDHTIIPTSGYVETTDEPDEGPASKKGGFFFTKKEKDALPQININEEDNLSGYVNIVGARYGEPKVKRKWITICGDVFMCAPSKDEQSTFSFAMTGIRVDTADKKEAKMKNAFKISRDGDNLLYIEALNKVDAGTLLKKLVEIMEKKPEKSSAAPSATEPEPEQKKATEGLVAKLMANFEVTPSDQVDGGGGQKLRPGNKDKEINPPPLPESLGEKKETEKERKAREKKEKKEREREEKEREKERKEKEKREKEDKKRREKEEKKKEKEVAAAAAEAAAKEAEETAPPPLPPSPQTSASNLAPAPAPAPAPASSPAPSPTPEKKAEPENKEETKPPLQRRSTVAKRLGDQSGTSHLILKDKLMQDRKELESKRLEASKKKTDLRNQMNHTSDPEAKAKLKQQMDAAQKEWSEINKQFVEISRQIEDATLDKDANDNNPAVRTAARAASPDREKVVTGTVSDRMKMFQGK